MQLDLELLDLIDASDELGEKKTDRGGGRGTARCPDPRLWEESRSAGRRIGDDGGNVGDRRRRRSGRGSRRRRSQRIVVVRRLVFH